MKTNWLVSRLYSEQRIPVAATAVLVVDMLIAEWTNKEEIKTR